MTFPWEEHLPASAAPTVEALARDFAYAIRFTAIQVHSDNTSFAFVVNTPRGQILPQGRGRFSDGTTFELQDLGMPQVGVETLTVPDLLMRLWEIAREQNIALLT